MSAHDDMRARRREFDEAVARRNEADAALRRHNAELLQLRQRFEKRRSAAVDERVEAIAARSSNEGLGTAGLHYESSMADLDDLKLEIQAAEVLTRRLEERSTAAVAVCDRAEVAWKKAVCRFAQAKEAAALNEVQAALRTLAAASAKAIAAAKVSKDHGEIRGSYNLDPDKWFGSGGRLVAEMGNIEWPTWPDCIDPKPFRTGQHYRIDQFSGVAEAEADLLRTVQGDA